MPSFDGIDVHSLAIDPPFLDPEYGDYRLKPESPVRKAGFLPLDFTRVGLQSREKGAP